MNDCENTPWWNTDLSTFKVTLNDIATAFNKEDMDYFKFVKEVAKIDIEESIKSFMDEWFNWCNIFTSNVVIVALRFQKWKLAAYYKDEFEANKDATNLILKYLFDADYKKQMEWLKENKWLVDNDLWIAWNNIIKTIDKLKDFNDLKIRFNKAWWELDVNKFELNVDDIIKALRWDDVDYFDFAENFAKKNVHEYVEKNYSEFTIKQLGKEDTDGKNPFWCFALLGRKLKVLLFYKDFIESTYPKSAEYIINSVLGYVISYQEFEEIFIRNGFFLKHEVTIRRKMAIRMQKENYDVNRPVWWPK